MIPDEDMALGYGIGYEAIIVYNSDGCHFKEGERRVAMRSVV